MAWMVLALELLALMAVGNYLWIRAVRSLAPEFQGRSAQIWFLGPLFSRREQFTTEGWHLCRLATGTGLIGFLVLALSALFMR